MCRIDTRLQQNFIPVYVEAKITTRPFFIRTENRLVALNTYAVFAYPQKASSRRYIALHRTNHNRMQSLKFDLKVKFKNMPLNGVNSA